MRWLVLLSLSFPSQARQLAWLPVQGADGNLLGNLEITEGQVAVDTGEGPPCGAHGILQCPHAPPRLPQCVCVCGAAQSRSFAATTRWDTSSARCSSRCGEKTSRTSLPATPPAASHRQPTHTPTPVPARPRHETTADMPGPRARLRTPLESPRAVDRGWAPAPAERVQGPAGPGNHPGVLRATQAAARVLRHADDTSL